MLSNLQPGIQIYKQVEDQAIKSNSNNSFYISNLSKHSISTQYNSNQRSGMQGFNSNNKQNQMQNFQKIEQNQFSVLQVSKQILKTA